MKRKLLIPILFISLPLWAQESARDVQEKSGGAKKEAGVSPNEETKAPDVKKEAQVEAALRKLSEALVKKDEAAALALMTKVKEAPEGYQKERLQHLLKWAESRGPVKIIESRALSEVAVVVINDAEAGQKSPDYDPMYLRLDGEQWKFADDGIFGTKHKVPSVSDISRKEFVELKEWFDAREKELKKRDAAASPSGESGKK